MTSDSSKKNVGVNNEESRQGYNYFDLNADMRQIVRMKGYKSWQSL